MLRRDKYTDKCYDYLPIPSYDKFWKAVSVEKQQHLLLESDIKRLKDMETVQMVKVGVVLSLSLLTTMFYTRIPILRENTKLIFRIPITLIIIW